MTIVFTAAQPFGIVTACDSAVREDAGEDTTYSTGRKHYAIEGSGVVTTWGSRDGNNIGRFLDSLPDDSKSGVDVLAASVRRFLEFEFNPRQRGAPDVGYHVSGFRDGHAEIHHIYWNAPGPGRPHDGVYESEPHVVPTGMFLLFNGRDDLANAVVNALIKEINSGQRIPMNLSRAFGVVSLAHLVLRFASEISFDVGPPFFAHVIDPRNEISTVELPSLQPLSSFSAMIQFAERIHNVVDTIKIPTRAV
jgi:hypothetical protein